MSAEEQASFLQGLAEDLNSKNITLPSFPDAVINIRTALEDPTCTADRLAEMARTDTVLVSRLLMSANSAFNNRAGINIVDLDLAISRLGFESVRNTAITLAVEQLFNASQHEDLRDRLKDLWSRSINMASMSYVIARSANGMNADNAFLCGLLHEVGKLYILTKAGKYPGFLGDTASVDKVLAEWHPSVGRSIVEAWGFPDEIVASVDLDEGIPNGSGGAANFADVLYAAIALLDANHEPDEELEPAPSLDRLAITTESRPELLEGWEAHSQSMRQ
jgi:HD-like signal output (HDOD) protein